MNGGSSVRSTPANLFHPSGMLHLDLEPAAAGGDAFPEGYDRMTQRTELSEDEQHMRLLSIFHYVVGGLTALIACLPLMHLTIGLFMLIAPESMAAKGEELPPAFVGWMFTCMGAGMFLAGLACAVCIALAGRFIARRTRYWFVFVLACFQCAFFPFGTALGVFTIIVLSRPSVKALFPGVLPAASPT